MAETSSIEFIEYKGRPLQVRPLSLSAQEELAQYLRFKYFSEAKKMFDGLPLPLAQYALDKAKAYSDKIYPGTLEHSQLFFTPAGWTYALFLASKSNENAPTVQEAYEILDSVPEAFQAVAKAVGYREDKSSSNNSKPLPISEIIHVLTNEPFNHTPAEVRSMTLDDIALIWCNPEAENKRSFSQADVDRAFAAARERAEKAKLGIWAEENIWRR